MFRNQNLLDYVYGAMMIGDSDRYGYAHVARVAAQAQTTAEWNVSVCHDVVEDGFATYNDLFDWGLSPEEHAAVRLLNRADSELTYAEYIDRLVIHRGTEWGDIAIAVKCYDLFDHLAPRNVQDRSRSGADRYLQALAKLVHAQIIRS